jgi:hypothetical protein
MRVKNEATGLKVHRTFHLHILPTNAYSKKGQTKSEDHALLLRS